MQIFSKTQNSSKKYSFPTTHQFFQIIYQIILLEEEQLEQIKKDQSLLLLQI